MAVECKIIQVPELRLCEDDGFINVFMAQPAVEVHRDEESGYGPSPAQTLQVEALIDECFNAVNIGAREHNLVIFPEAMVPRSRIHQLHHFIDACPNNTVVIAGIECLPTGCIVEDTQFPIGDDEREQLRINLKPEHRFINCCFTLIRDSTGTTSTHFQAKIDPSHPEQSLPGMFNGNEVILFSSGQFSFMTMICSDLIQKSDRTLLLSQQILDSANNKWDTSGAGTALCLDAIVNIQCNPKPNHRSFREACRETLGIRQNILRINDCQIILANWGNFWDGEEPIVSSAIVYQTNHWRPTRKDDRDVPPVFSFTRDQMTDRLNIVAFRSQGHGYYRFRMLPCVRANANDSSIQYPVRNAVFHRDLGTDRYQVEHKSAWHDRCERWLPSEVNETVCPEFWGTNQRANIEDRYHETYRETRRQILEKSPNNLKCDCLCLTLSDPEAANPDLWDDDQRLGLTKWAALATLFCFDDNAIDLTGSDWFCLKWRDHVCVAFIDGYNKKSCQGSLELYDKTLGRQLPQDPNFDDSLLIVLFRHTNDKREHRQAVSFNPQRWTESMGANRLPGVRPDVFRKNSEYIANAQFKKHVFWCTAEDFDAVREAESQGQLNSRLGDVCEAALG